MESGWGVCIPSLAYNLPCYGVSSDNGNHRGDIPHRHDQHYVVEIYWYGPDHFMIQNVL
jgi:hypothetical protein